MYQWLKGIAKWQVGKTLYLSVPFTWLMDDARAIAAAHKGPSMIGGPGTMAPSECPGFDPLMFHNPCATFTTRGCPNRCAFCAVPELEGDFRELQDFRPAPIICDNNFTAASERHIRWVVNRLKDFLFIDFNQGLEARRFTPWIADTLGELKCKVRFALDHVNQEGAVKDAIDLCRKRTTKDIGVYVLFGFNDTPDDALYRLELVRSWGIRPTAMRYQPLDARVKNEYIGPGWTAKDLSRMSRYYNRLRYVEHIPYEDFDYLRGDDQGELFT